MNKSDENSTLHKFTMTGSHGACQRGLARSGNGVDGALREAHASCSSFRLTFCQMLIVGTNSVKNPRCWKLVLATSRPSMEESLSIRSHSLIVYSLLLHLPEAASETS